MDQNPYAASSTSTVTVTATGVDIEQLDVSDRWKTYFRGIHKYLSLIHI